jgi:drug/metabolite transporter (DMT)-like permease
LASEPIDPAIRAARVLPLTILALFAFAGNSLLARMAFTRSQIDPASFTSIRLISGAMVLFLIIKLRRRRPARGGSWPSAVALFVYAAGFSFAYVKLTTGTGALLLFGAVQATMITVGVMRGERLTAVQAGGLLIACAGLVGLMLPGLAAPPLLSAALMVAAGVAWGAYSLRAKGAGDPTAATAGNFARAVPLTIVLSFVAQASRSIDASGVQFAVASGALTSGVGYAVWYSALRGLHATTAATVQLSVPVLAALGGVLLLHEPLTGRLAIAGAAILGGVAIVVLTRARVQAVE